jgi:hypothetical protein
MRVGNIGIGAFHPPRQIVAHEQVQYAIDTVGRHALVPRLGYGLGNVIGAGGLGLAGQRVIDIAAHLGPLLSRFFKRAARGSNQPFAGMFVMMMQTHGRLHSPFQRGVKSAL